MSLAALWLFLSAFAQGEQVNPYERPGAVAPANRWYVKGGCAARTGMSESQVPRGRVRAEWSFTSDWTIEGEPLVWGDTIVLALHFRGKKRELRIFDLRSGEQVGRPVSFKSALPLEPTLWGSVVVVRSTSSRLEGFRIGKRGLRRVWTHRTKMPVGPPLQFEDEVYFCTGGALERRVVGESKPVWRVEADVQGSVSLVGEAVYAVTIDSNGSAAVQQFSRADGVPGSMWRIPLEPDAIQIPTPAPFSASLHPGFMVVDLGANSAKGGGFVGIPAEARNHKNRFCAGHP